MSNIDNITLEYLSAYIKLNGIKPEVKDIIYLNDPIDTAILKFNRWFNEAFYFAQGDQRDMYGFIQLNDNFLNTIKNIDNNNFLNHVKNIITNNLYPDKNIISDNIIEELRP